MPDTSVSRPMTLLSISIVCYQPDFERLTLLFNSLARAVSLLAQQGEQTQVFLVDHGQQGALLAKFCQRYQASLKIELLENPANPGFGAGHNLALKQANSRFHLVLNPDVVVPDATLTTLLAFARSHPDVVALSPEVRDAGGKLQYLCKTRPSVLDLALRGFAPAWLKQVFSARLGRYEYRTMVDTRTPAKVELLSGCFMLCRTRALQTTGFDEGYFLYFEDFALSHALHRYGELRYLPEACIVHFGGNSSAKGLSHIRYFLASAWRYFNQFGWRLW